MIPGDEELSAWLDGGLGPERAATLAAQTEADPQLARRVDRLRQIDALVREAVPTEEEVPQALLERLGLADPVGTVASLDAARTARAAQGTPQIQSPVRKAWAGGRLAAQAAVLAGLGLLGGLYLAINRPDDPQAQFHALGDKAAAAQPNAVAMFAPGTSDDRVRALLDKAGAKALGEPTPEGMWKLALPVESREAALAALRADPAVTLAEPINDGAER